MFSDADPVVALDPKQQHGELTKPGVYSGILVAISCLHKTNNNLCIACSSWKNTHSSVFCAKLKKKKNLPKYHLSGHQSSSSLSCFVSSEAESEIKQHIAFNLLILRNGH